MAAITNPVIPHPITRSTATSGAALALASLLGGAMAAGLALLLASDASRQAQSRPAARSSQSEAESRASAEEAIQRTMESRSF